MNPDPFGTSAVRERVLAGWAASPVRFREDANAEEDLALGAYRDRLVVEVAQNAADAARRAGVPGRLLLQLQELDGRAVLVAANTGAALDADGVQALATLRASAKREAPEAGPQQAVGRFGVGFSAVLAVTDEPAVVSRHGGVRFSAADTRDLVEELAGRAPGLVEELARRDGHVPVLRLPFPAEGMAPAGYDTAVLLPLRDSAAEDLVLRLLDEVGDPLLLALPGLDEVSVAVPGAPVRTVTGVQERWHVLRRSGRHDPALLADRPTEERARTAWSLAWALPRSAATPVPAVLHAPTPSEEPLDWPALLVASVPLDPARRHVAPGPAADAMVAHAAQAYADLLTERAGAGVGVWTLIPVGLAAGALDAALRERVLRALPDRPVLRSGLPDGAPVRPRDAVALELPAGADEEVVAALAAAVPGLVLAPRQAGAALAALGVRRVPLADAVEALPGVADPGHWHRLYTLLGGLAVDPQAREALAAIPVPLTDGRVVRGARGVVLPGGGPAVGAALGVLGARAVHPAAMHPLLERLGGLAVGPRSALELPEVRSALEGAEPGDRGRGDLDDYPGDQGPQDSAPPEGTDTLAGAVLALVEAAVHAGELHPGELPWLATVWLEDDGGEPVAAGGLALPGSAAAEVFDPEVIGVVGPSALARWGEPVLRAAGVLDGLPVLRGRQLVLDPDGGPSMGGPSEESAGGAGWSDAQELSDLDGWDGWVGTVRAAVERQLPPEHAVGELVVPELVVLRDLDAVRDGAWARVLSLVAADPVLRAAVVAPVRVLVRGPGGVHGVDVAPYSAWWLRRRLAGGEAWADPGATSGLARLLPPAPPLLAATDGRLRAALGAVRTAGDLDDGAVRALLDGLADPTVSIDAATALQVWSGLAELAGTADVDPPTRVRVLDGAGTRVVAAADAVVVDSPVLLQRPDLGGALLAPTPQAALALAELLDLPLAAELVAGRVTETAR